MGLVFSRVPTSAMVFQDLWHCWTHQSFLPISQCTELLIWPAKRRTVMRFSTHYHLRQNGNSWLRWAHQRLSNRRLLQREDKKNLSFHYFCFFSSLENFEERENKFRKEWPSNVLDFCDNRSNRRLLPCSLVYGWIIFAVNEKNCRCDRWRGHSCGISHWELSSGRVQE